MADDITLTVRVRDLTRGDFDRLGRRLRGIDDEVQRFGDSNQAAADRVQRLSSNLRDAEGRLADLQQTGRGTREDMTHLRRTMSLLDRDLRNAGRSGEITGDDFERMRAQVERARLDFDYLSRDVERHNAVAQRVHRAEQARQREEDRTAARLAREERDRNRQRAQDLVAAARLRAREEARAEREAAAVRAAAIRRRQQQDREAQRAALAQQRADLAQLRNDSGDVDFTMRFRNLGDDDLRRMDDSIGRLQSNLRGLSGTSVQARRNIGALNRDFSTMSRILQDAGDSGSLARRDFNALNNGLTILDRTARSMVRSGDMSRDMFRHLVRDTAALRAQLVSLGDGDGILNRLTVRLRAFQARMRDTDSSAGRLRRSMNRMGDWGAGGMIAALAGMRLFTGLLAKMGVMLRANKRWAAILIAVLALIGPVAQALGVLLVAVLGGAFIALGALALKSNDQVKSAFQDMKSTVIAVVKEAAAPMASDLAGGLRQVGDAAREMQPQLTSAFSAAGPLIDDMFGGITDLFAMALPGFASALGNSQKAMEGFRTGMGLIGKGFGDMMRIITSGNEDELKRAWITLGDELRNLLESLGEFISTSLNSEAATAMMIAVFRTLTGILNLVAGGFKLVDSIAGDALRNLTNYITGMKMLETAGTGVGGVFVDSSKGITQMQKELAALDKQIAAFEKATGDLTGPHKDHATTKDGKTLGQLKAQRDALNAAIEASEGLTAANQAQEESTESLYESVMKLNEAHRSSVDARARLEEAYEKGINSSADLRGALQVENGEFVLTSQKARDAWKALSDVAEATNSSTKAAIEAEKPWSTVERRFMDGREKLLALAESLDLSAEAVQILTEEILEVPDKEVKLKADKKDLESKLAVARKKLASVPDSRKAAVRAEIAQLEQKIGEAKRLLRSVDGTTVHTYVYTNYLVNAATGAAKNRRKLRAGSEARGGTIGSAAVGGPRSNLTWVGEQGPELVRMAPGSRVHSNPDSERMVRGMSSGSSEGPIVIQLNIGDKYLGEVMIDPLRKAVRTRGGNVQAVLGKGGG